eukprot:TRINITY_DN3609_c0_g1_i2.p1 TRINITY_DN3609_c0_g1~~TRINITY_DN3609_c0_g1_i2.p1  ORF type:complete len:1124 (+),score=235.87 TRINITY_DN3609_c0_g1_i2:56-3427(+)
MKRFSSLDVNFVVRDLHAKCAGLRIANIYDVEKKTYLFKLQRPDHKEYLLIESGVRVHTTEYQREHSDFPSVFANRLRKFLRTKRIEKVSQLGIDRVIDFTIGVEPNHYHLLIELYSSGNIILTNGTYEILTQIRTYTVNIASNDYTIAPGQQYPIHTAHQLVPTSLESLQQTITSVDQAKRTSETLKSIFNKELDFGASMVEHAILSAGLNPDTTIANYDLSCTEALLNAFKEVEARFTSPDRQKGYIILKRPLTERPTETSPAADGEKQKPEYDSKQFIVFAPILYKQYEGKDSLEFDSFDAAVDTFFSKTEAQKIDVKRDVKEDTVSKKLEKAKQNQDRRIEALSKDVSENVQKAQLIEMNSEDVENAIMTVRTEIADGVDWEELADIIKDAKRGGDPVASMISQLKLDTSEITLLLPDLTQYEPGKKTTVFKIDVDIHLSAFGNAERYYHMKKRSEAKHQKTIEMAQHAMKQAERKAKQAMEEVKVKASIQQIRKTHWFEKFYWFISSENYVVLSGRDAQQNELLVKRYMRKGDIYVHADIHGASSCVVRNNDLSKPIPPLTLSQAGHMTVCRSNAWNAKVVTSAWWVYDHQVSKTAPSGEYLSTGSFMIRGKKNYLPAAHLVMGFGFMFRVDDSCISNHVGERRVRGEGEDESVEAEEDGEELDEDAPKVRTLRQLPSDPVKEAPSVSKLDETREEVQEEASNESTNLPQPSMRYRVAILSETPQDEDDVLLAQSTKPKSQPQSTSDGGDPPKRSVNVAERKRLKREAKRAAAPPNQQDHPPSQQQKNQQSAKQTQARPQQPVSKRQKAKQKKIQKKYGDQDEEDRRLHMELLASAGNPEKMQQKREQEEKRKRDLEHQLDLQQRRKDQQKVETAQWEQKKKLAKHIEDAQTSTTIVGDDGEVYHITSTSGMDLARVTSKTPGALNIEPADKEPLADEEPEVDDEHSDDDDNDHDHDGANSKEDLLSQEEKQKQRRERREAKKREELEIKAIIDEEGGSLLTDEDKKNVNELDTLTGIPKEQDLLLYAVPVCGPYHIFQNYKYKVKLLPGKGKKGAASKTILAYFQRVPGGSDREHDLLKSVNETETIQQLIGNVRVLTPGFAAKKQAKNKPKAKSHK